MPAELSRIAVALFLLATLGCGGSDSPSNENRDAESATRTEQTTPERAVNWTPEPFVVTEPTLPTVAERTEAQEAGSVRLLYSDVRVEIERDIATTVVTDVLVNDLDSEVDAAYTFPLPEDASVVGFAHFIDGERMEATVTGREEAQAGLEEATAEGERAAVLETSPQARFRIQLSPLAAGSTRRVELTYTQSLRGIGGEKSYVFPGAHSEGKRPRMLELNIRVVGGHPLERVRTPNHTGLGLFHPDETAVEARLALLNQALGLDFVLSWQEDSPPIELSGRSATIPTPSEPSDTPATDEEPDIAEPDIAEIRFAFNAVPEDAVRPPHDVIVVIDRSLSMAGPALRRAKELTRLTLSELTERDRFALITFSDRIESWDGLTEVGDETRARATTELDALRPAGYSNIDAAIDQAATLAAGSTAPTVLFITDGQSTLGTDPDALTPGVESEAFASAKVVVALFNYPSRQAALDAFFPSASTRYVPEGPAGEEAVIAIARMTAAASIDQLHIEIDGIPVDAVAGLVPERLPRGERVTLFARGADLFSEGSLRVRIMGQLFGEPFHRDLEVPAPDAVGDPDRLERGWATTRAMDLTRDYDASEDDEVRRSLREAIVHLGTTHQVATRFTSFLARDRLSPDRIRPGDPEIRVNASPSASSVIGMLPWGEVIECSYDLEQQVWLGRFLIPRNTPDGLYRVRLFVDMQGEVEYRGSLPFRVDSEAPRLDLEVTQHDGRLFLVARPREFVFEQSGDSIREGLLYDAVDMKRITVRVGESVVTMTRQDNDFRAEMVAPVAGHYEVELVAVDYATNVSRVQTTFEVVE